MSKKNFHSVTTGKKALQYGAAHGIGSFKNRARRENSDNARKEKIMSYYHKCPDCGANLDPCEKCTCTKGKEGHQSIPNAFEKETPTTAESLSGYGFDFDANLAATLWHEAYGHAPTKGNMSFLEANAVYAAAAYQTGVEGGKLSDLFPYITESAPAAGTAETRSNSPKATTPCGNDSTPGAGLQEGKSV